MTSNIHNLLHIIDDVQRFGILPSISAYPFESCLGKFKSLIRTGPAALPQIARRMIERNNVLYNVRRPSNEGPSIKRTGLNKCSIQIPHRNFILCNHRFEDQWFLANNQIMRMVNALEIDSEIFLEARPLLATNNFFDVPLPSSWMNIFQANIAASAVETTRIRTSQIECKFICILLDGNTHVFVPILHTEK